MSLNAQHIDYIINDLNCRGIIHETLKDELVDHICTCVENEMSCGSKFLDAYHKVLKDFGHTAGLRKIQHQTLRSDNYKTNIMIRNYFTIAVRNLLKHRFYTFINVLGLAVGVASCLVIILFVTNEMSFDRHHEKVNRIYRVNGEIKFAGSYYNLAVAPAPLASALMTEYPEVESAVRFRQRGTYLVKQTESTDNFKEAGVVWADNSVFEIFTIPIISGDHKNALTDPGSVAISEKVAEKYFHGKDAVGQSLILDNRWHVKVSAVFANMPATGHFHFDILISMAGLDESKAMNFMSNNFNTYILLKVGTDVKALEKKLPGLIEKYIGPQAAATLGGEFTMEKFRASGNKLEYTLMPVTDIHLRSDRTAELAANGNILYVYLFSSIAVFILVIACINFMNLSTARSANRAKEVGVRKVLGSMRSHLIRQFLIESVLLSIFSFVLAVGVAYLILPFFNELAAKSLQLPFQYPLFYFIIFTAALIVGLLAGLYPSVFLSAFKPVNVLKGNLSLGMKSGTVRSSLVVFQFVISIILIVATITVNRQLNYIQNKNIGFKKDQVLVIDDAYALGEKIQSFKDEVLKNTSVVSGTISGYLPVSGTWRNDNSFWVEGNQPTQDNMVGMQNWLVDYDYARTLGMKIISGRDFSPEFPSDSSAVILNQSAVKQFQLGENPVGKRISTLKENRADGSPDPESVQSFSVVGVVEDFHFESLKQNITPLGLMMSASRGMVSFRFEAKNTKDVIVEVEKTWKALAPGQPFQYSFLDDDFDRMYSGELRLGKTFALFAGLAIVIACLGLFALTAFTAEQRTKEIGIRKVLGASVGSIVVLLSKEFAKLIIISFLIASPIAWYAVMWWLQNYTYKVEIGIFVYLVAGLSAFGVAWFTMGYQSIRAAMSNPVNSLRSE